MKYKDILYENKTLYKLKPNKHELKYLSCENLKIILRQSRIMINQANKYNNIESINSICHEIDSIYRIYSIKNNSSIKQLNAFNTFLIKTVRNINKLILQEGEK